MFEPTEFQKKVVAGHAEAFAKLDESTAYYIQLQIAGMERRGWTVEDATAYVGCMEEITPGLSESVALDRMHKISQKYKTK